MKTYRLGQYNRGFQATDEGDDGVDTPPAPGEEVGTPEPPVYTEFGG